MSERADDNLIEQFLLGKLPPHRADQLCVELADDSRVVRLGQAPDAGDSLLATLRAQRDLADEPSSPRLERLLEGVRRHLADQPPARTEHAPPLPPGMETIIAPELPRELGHFALLGVLGAGGMGVVYHARDRRLDRPVALKVIRAELAARPEVHERFLREARHAATVDHPNVIAIHQVGEVEGVPFLAMPLLLGETLDARLTRAGQPLPSAEALHIGREAAEGLAAAHGCGLIHRDIKPSNLWLQALDGNRFRVVLLDFGLARLQDQQSTFTESGALLGTPGYMAPEQVRGKAVDHRADLFSLGCVLYQMTTGSRPFPGSDPLAVLASLALDHPEPPARLNGAVPPALSELILRLLEKEPTRRPASAREVADQLAAIERQPTVDIPRRRGRIGVLGLAAGFAGVALAALLVFRQLPESSATVQTAFGIDRAAATWAVGAGGRVEFVHGNHLLLVGPGEPLPAEPLPVFAIHLDHVAAVTDADLARFAGLPELSYLSLSDSNVGDAGLALLTNLPKLRGLFLNRTRVSNDGLRHLARFPALGEVHVIDTQNPITNEGLAHFANVPELQDLGVGPGRLSGGCTKHLRRCRSVETLMLRAPLQTEEELADLASLLELRRLELSSDELPAAALAGLVGATRLEVLTLNGPRLDGDCLVALGRLPRLKTLRLSGAVLRPDDCRHFESFPVLEHLRLDDAGLTDDAVPHLSRLTRLRSLHLPRNRLAPARVRELQKALASCQVGFE